MRNKCLLTPNVKKISDPPPYSIVRNVEDNSFEEGKMIMLLHSALFNMHAAGADDDGDENEDDDEEEDKDDNHDDDDDDVFS